MAGPYMGVPGFGTLFKGTWAAGQVFWQLPLLPEHLPLVFELATLCFTAWFPIDWPSTASNCHDLYI